MSKKPHSASADGEDVLIKDGISGFLNPAEMFKLRRLALLSRYTVEGNLAGAHRSPKHGPSSEFASHKPYGMGDDPKHIDWRVMARTDKYYVKQYEDETNLRVYLALDRSASMGYKSAGRIPTPAAPLRRRRQPCRRRCHPRKRKVRWG